MASGADLVMFNREYDVDNKDVETTWLWIDLHESPEGYLEVDPWKLVCDAIENLELSVEEQTQLLAATETLKKQVVLAFRRKQQGVEK